MMTKLILLLKKCTYLYVILLLYCFLLIRCNDNTNYKNRYTLNPANNTTSLKLKDGFRNFSNHIQYFQCNNINYLATLNTKNNSLEFYNLDSSSFVKETKVQYEGNHGFGAIKGFLILNFDSIVVISLYPKKVGLVDSCGKLIKSISYDKDKNNISTMSSLPTNGLRPFIIGRVLYLSQFYQAFESNGILTEDGYKNSYLALSINLITGECILLPATYPAELIGTEVSAMPVLRVLGYNNSFVYFFRNIESFYATTDNSLFIKYPIEVNYKLNFLKGSNSQIPLEKAFYLERTHDNILNIYYDEYRQCYYVIIKKAITSSNNDFFVSQNSYPDCFILVLDKELKHLGEVHFPDNTYSFQMCFITEEGLYISEDNVNNPTFSEDYMRFRLFRLEKVRN